jgi:hypothetical protein
LFNDFDIEMRSSNLARNLNSTSDGERQSFLSELQIFLKTRNKSISRIPTLGHKELDLMGLYREVLNRGGVEEVSFFNFFNTHRSSKINNGTTL